MTTNSQLVSKIIKNYWKWVPREVFEVHGKEYFLGRWEARALQRWVGWKVRTDLYVALWTTPSSNFLLIEIQTIEFIVQIEHFHLGQVLNWLGCWNSKQKPELFQANQDNGHPKDDPFQGALLMTVPSWSSSPWVSPWATFQMRSFSCVPLLFVFSSDPVFLVISSTPKLTLYLDSEDI